MGFEHRRTEPVDSRHTTHPVAVDSSKCRVARRVGSLLKVLFMRLGGGVFLGCDVLVDGPIVLQDRMWASDRRFSIYILANILVNILVTPQCLLVHGYMIFLMCTHTHLRMMALCELGCLASFSSMQG